MRKRMSPAELGFDRYDQGRLRRALKAASDKRTYVRLQAVLLVAQGMDALSVAKLLDKSVQIIYRWVRLYTTTHRPGDLLDAPRSGRPPAAPAITEERILRELGRNPLELGYHTTVWTVEVLARHLNACYGSNIAPRTLYRRMKAMGLRSKRPRYVYSEKDPNRTQKKGPSCES